MGEQTKEGKKKNGEGFGTRTANKEKVGAPEAAGRTEKGIGRTESGQSDWGCSIKALQNPCCPQINRCCPDSYQPKGNVRIAQVLCRQEVQATQLATQENPSDSSTLNQAPVADENPSPTKEGCLLSFEKVCSQSLICETVKKKKKKKNPPQKKKKKKKKKK